jgi:hypothetical protein
MLRSPDKIDTILQKRNQGVHHAESADADICGHKRPREDFSGTVGTA